MNELYNFLKAHLLSDFAVTANLIRGGTGTLTEFTETEADL